MVCGQDTVTGAGTEEREAIEHEGRWASSHPEGPEKKSDIFSKSSEKALANFKAGMLSSELHFEKIPMIPTEVPRYLGFA